MFRRRLILYLLLFCHIYPIFAAERIKIQINGIDEKILPTVNAYLRIEQQKADEHLNAIRIKSLHQSASAEIIKAVQAFGFYQTEVKANLTEPTEKTNFWQATYDVKLGEAIQLKTVDITIKGEGQQDENFTKIVEDFPLKVNDVLHHGLYQTGKKQFQDLSLLKGYFDADWEKHEIIVKKQANTAHLNLVFNTDKQYKFGNVNFKQAPDDFFEQNFLNQFLTFKNGDAYSYENLVAFRKGLTLNHYFEDVIINKQRLKANKTLNLDVNLGRRLPNEYRTRIGYGTDTEARFGFDWQRNYWNRYGHYSNIGVATTQKRRQYVFDANYAIPTGQIHVLPPSRIYHDYIEFSARYEGEDLESEQITGSAFALTGMPRQTNWLLQVDKHHLRHFLGLTLEETLGLGYLAQKYNIFDHLSSAVQTAPENQSLRQVLIADYQLIIPSVSWAYTKSDSKLYPKNGQHIELTFRGALSNLGSNTDFLQILLESITIRPLGKKGRVIVRGSVGYTDAKQVTVLDKTFYRLPELLLFKTGGDHTVRGYKFESLDDTGLGGIHQLVGSIEYEHKILDKWGVAGFYDVGNVFGQFSTSNLQHGAGLGVRWYSPVGIVRLDIATALSKDHRPVRLHFTVGAEF